MDRIFPKLHDELVAEKRRHHVHNLVVLLHVSSAPRTSTAHTCPMRIVFIDTFSSHAHCTTASQMRLLKERMKPHAPSTTPEHTWCFLCPVICLSPSGSPERLCL